MFCGLDPQMLIFNRKLIHRKFEKTRLLRRRKVDSLLRPSEKLGSEVEMRSIDSME